MSLCYKLSLENIFKRFLKFYIKVDFYILGWALYIEIKITFLELKFFGKSTCMGFWIAETHDSEGFWKSKQG